MQFIINLIIFFLILGLIITIHEFGHFFTAKLFGVYCGEFSIGMGPLLYQKQKGETKYSLRALPIGGYVAMAGEADQEDNEEFADVPYERTLKGIKTWKKCVVMLAGVFMNFVLAFVLLVGAYSTVDVAKTEAYVGDFSETSAAKSAGIKKGDLIESISIDGTLYDIDEFNDIGTILTDTEITSAKDTKNAVITVLRENKEYSYDVKLTYNTQDQRYYLGITAETEKLGLLKAISYSLDQLKTMSLLIFTTLGQIITKFSSTVSQLSGPVGIYKVTSEVASTGSIANMAILTALLSTNIGIFNLLPIPGLDGSQVLFALIERAIGRDIPVKIKYILQILGLSLIFSLMIFVTIQDLI